MTPKPMTPAVEAVSKLLITGNVTPHVWYQRTEFRTDSNRPDRDMITALADIVYWYRAKEIRDEETGVFVGYERKFARDMLQYDYARRAAVFGMSKRQMQEACNKLSRRGLVRIEYRTENFRGKALSNVVYVEPVAEAIALTLTGPNVESAEKAKGAPRGVHAKKAEQDATYNPDAGVDDQTPDGTGDGGDDTSIDPDQGVSQNSGTGGEEDTSQNSGTGVSQNSGTPTPENWDTYHESSLEISSSRDFRTSSSTPVTGDARTGSGSDDDGHSANAGTAAVARPSPAEGSEATAPARSGRTQEQGAELESATSTENVPPAAAAGGSAILALLPVPRAELEGRPARDPARMVQLRALLSASHKSRLPHLEAELALATRSGVPLSLLTRLTDDELSQAAVAGRADAGLVEGGFTKAGVHALHRLIGEPLTLATLKGERPQRSEQSLGRAYDVKNGGQVAPTPDAPAAAEGRLRPGAMWRHKKTLEVVMIRGMEGGEYVLSSGQQVSMLALNRQYEFEAAPSEASA